MFVGLCVCMVGRVSFSCYLLIEHQVEGEGVAEGLQVDTQTLRVDRLKAPQQLTWGGGGGLVKSIDPLDVAGVWVQSQGWFQ